MNALAYTDGHDIVFARNAYDPATNDGRQLIAHELVHTVQQESAGRMVQCKDPDPAVEAAALRKGTAESSQSAGLLEDALLIAVAQTGVPVVAFDAAELDGEVWLRRARAGERLAEDSRAIPEGRPVLADTARAVAAPFGPVDAAAPVTAATERIALAALEVKGVPEMSIEEALWTVVEILREAA